MGTCNTRHDLWERAMLICDHISASLMIRWYRRVRHLSSGFRTKWMKVSASTVRIMWRQNLSLQVKATSNTDFLSLMFKRTIRVFFIHANSGCVSSFVANWMMKNPSLIQNRVEKEDASDPISLSFRSEDKTWFPFCCSVKSCRTQIEQAQRFSTPQ